jgi:hypothetical protein
VTDHAYTRVYDSHVNNHRQIGTRYVWMIEPRWDKGIINNKNQVRSTAASAIAETVKSRINNKLQIVSDPITSLEVDGSIVNNRISVITNGPVVLVEELRSKVTDTEKIVSNIVDVPVMSFMSIIGDIKRKRSRIMTNGRRLSDGTR